MKQCPKCGEYLARDKFYTRQNGGPASWCKTCVKRANRDRYLAPGGQERQRRSTRRYRYGMDAASYQVMLEEQGGLCAICRRKPDGPGGLHIDHNHATGVVRGLLCASCNMGLGQFRDSPDIMDAALTYLHHGFVGP